MASVAIDDTHLRITIEGVDRVHALRSHLDIPLAHVMGVGIDPEVVCGFHDLRLPGTYLPGVVIAGSFYDGEWLLFDVRDADKAIKINLDHEHYRAVIIEVDDPGRDRGRSSSPPATMTFRRFRRLPRCNRTSGAAC